MNKKSIGIVAISILVVGLLIVSIMINPEQTESTNSDTYDIMDIAAAESNKITNQDMKDFIYINVDEYLNYYQDSQRRVVLMARPTCQYCQIAEPILQKIAKDYQINIYYLNTSEVVTEDQEKLLSSNELFQSGFGTPFLVIIENNKIIGHVSGLTDKKHYLQALTDGGIIKK